MANTIKVSTYDVNGMKIGTSNVAAVYVGTNLVWPSSHQQVPCFAVTPNISTYTDTEFIDVYDATQDKWYKLNNLNEYEEYGIYGSGRTECGSQTATTCSATCIERTSTYNGYIPLGETFTDGTVIDIDFQMTEANGGVVIGDYGSNDSNDWRVFINYYGQVNNWLIYDFDSTRQYYNTGDWSQRFHLEIGNYYIKDVASGNYLINATAKTSFTRPNQMYLFHMEGSQISSFIDYGKVYSLKIYKNNTLVKDFIPWTDCNGNFGLYDKVSSSVTQSVGTMSGETTVVEQCTTTYEGKLTLDNGYEYEYSGDTWVNVGEVSGGSRLPEGYTEVDYVENTSSAYIDLDVYPYSSATNSYKIETKISSTQGTNQFEYLFSCEQGNTSPYYGCVLRWQTTNPRGLLLASNPDNASQNITYNDDGTSAITLSCAETQGSNTTPLTLWCGKSGNTVWRNGKGKFYTFKLTVNNSLVRDMIPCKRDSDSKAGMYDIVNDVFYTSNNGYDLVAGAETSGGTIYPIYYDEKADPQDNVTFTSMTEAREYECPWVGMHATIGGDKYVFSAVTSGYAWVEWTLPYNSEVAYLEDSGTQYINTGIYLNTANFEVGCEIVADNSIWGYCHQNVANGTWIGLECISGQKTAFYGRWGSSYMVNITSYMNSTANTIVYKQNGVTVNGTTISKNIRMGSDSIANQPLVFYARYDFARQGVETYSYPQKYKSFYIKNNNELVIDLIAVRVGTVGYMYDRVSGQLFGNSGSGNFIVGPDI